MSCVIKVHRRIVDINCYVIVDNSVFVLINSGRSQGNFESVTLPERSNWKLVANNDSVRISEGIMDADLSTLQGGHVYNFDLPPTSLRIWIRK